MRKYGYELKKRKKRRSITIAPISHFGVFKCQHQSVFVFQSGLIVACYYGYVDVVIALSQCPYIDVNWQDNEGNTALITAAQAGKKRLRAPIHLLLCCSQAWYMINVSLLL